MYIWMHINFYQKRKTKPSGIKIKNRNRHIYLQLSNPFSVFIVYMEIKIKQIQIQTKIVGYWLNGPQNLMQFQQHSHRILISLFNCLLPFLWAASQTENDSNGFSLIKIRYLQKLFFCFYVGKNPFAEEKRTFHP